jgi:hypothetical protein
VIARGLAVALLLSLAMAGLQIHRLDVERTAHANTRADHAEQRTDWERSTRVAVEAVRTEEQRRATALQGVIDDAEKNLARARADADAAGDAGQRLRKRLAEITGACRGGGAASNSAAASAGPATDATGDLLAHVQRRLDDAASGIARYADQSAAAGKACQRSYDALTAPGGGLRR